MLNCSEEICLKSKRQQKKLLHQLHISSAGVLINVSAYYGLINLQSSLNIRDALGTIGLTTGYIASVFWALLLSPLAIDHLGPKLALIISEASYIAYCAANFYPDFLTLIPGSILLGFGEACCWSSMSVLVAYYGEQYFLLNQQIKEDDAATPEVYSGSNSIAPIIRDNLITTSLSLQQQQNRLSKGSNSEINKDLESKNGIVSFFFGRYFTIVKGGQVIGNLLSYVALFGAKAILKVSDDKNETKTIRPSFANDSSSSLPFENNETSARNDSTLDLSFCGINDCAVSLKAMSEYNLRRYTAQSTSSVNLLLGIFVFMHFIAITMHYFLLDDIFIKGKVSKDNNKKLLEGCWNKSVTSLIKVFRQMVSLQQILASPIAIYFGLFLSYCLSEFTRAFISCPFGVENVGLVMMLFGASSMASALILGKFIPKFGRNPLYALAVVVDISCYISNFFWKPSANTFYAVYIMAIAFGFSAGLWEPLINSTYAHYFSDNTSAAFSLWNFWGALGLFTGFTLSTTVCLSVKVYVLLGVLGVSMGCYVLAEIRF